MLPLDPDSPVTEEELDLRRRWLVRELRLLKMIDRLYDQPEQTRDASLSDGKDSEQCADST